MTPPFAHGDPVPVSELGGAWEVEALVLVYALVALALFAQAFVRLRRRGRKDHAGWSRAVLFCAGITVGTLALLSPLDSIGEQYLLSAHMLQHLLIADIAPALILLAVRGPLLFFLLPAAILRPLAHVRPLRAALSFLLRPQVSFAVWALALAFWHVPGAYALVLTQQWAHDLQHLSFVLAGILVWTQLIDPARRGVPTRAGRIAFAVAVFACGTILADVLIFSFEPLYEAYAAQDERLLGISPLLDQRLAALVMMAEQLLALGLAVILILRGSRPWSRRLESRSAVGSSL